MRDIHLYSLGHRQAWWWSLAPDRVSRSNHRDVLPRSYTNLSGSFENFTTGSQKTTGGYVAIVMIYLFAVFYDISWNGIPWIFSYVRTRSRHRIATC